MLLKSITLKNFLSFGTEQTLELRPLNILIGVNGAGKSNLIEGIRLLRADSDFVRKIITPDWIWGGPKESSPDSPASARLGATLSLPKHDGEVTYHLSLLEDAKSPGDLGVHEGVEHDDDRDIGEGRSRWMDWLSTQFSEAFIYQKIIPHAWFPMSSRSASMMPDDVLMPYAQNLIPVIARMSASPTINPTVLDALSALHDNITDFGVQLDERDCLCIYVQESERRVFAERFSTGMRTWLSLLAILCTPVPPPLICIEHPEQGLHPDVLPKLADLLKAASERTQLIVTTHSETLLDALTDTPEAVVVVEKGEQGTTLTRLDADKMKPWLEKYRLGDLWMCGQLGGTRW